MPLLQNGSQRALHGTLEGLRPCRECQAQASIVTIPDMASFPVVWPLIMHKGWWKQQGPWWEPHEGRLQGHTWVHT